MNTGSMMKTFRWFCLLAACWLPSVAFAQDAEICDCIDMVLLVDETESMLGPIDNVKAGLTNAMAAAALVTSENVRFAVVTFSDDIAVVLPFTNDVALASQAIMGLTLQFDPFAGDQIDTPSDEALDLVVNGTNAVPATCGVNQPLGPLGDYRENCRKMAVLVTDTFPQGCNGLFTPGVDDLNASNVAVSAAQAGVQIQITAIQVGGSPFGQLADIMMTYADITGGDYAVVPISGVGTADPILDILAECGQVTIPGTFPPSSKPALHDGCITRDARYWFTHAYSAEPTAATLLLSLQVNDRPLPIGFLELPMEFRNADSVKDEYDGLIEALGLYYRSQKRTGEDSGIQNGKRRGSKLCRERKRLAVELIATMANNALLGTGTENCTYEIKGSLTNFPPDLIEQAGQAMIDGNVDEIRPMTVLLKTFNSSGTTANFLPPLVEPAANLKKELKRVARDPSTQITCPGFNDLCESAQPLASFPHQQRLNLSGFSDDIGGPICAGGGREAVWRISPPVAAAGRSFIVTTGDSDFATVISVLEGQCNPLNTVACGNNEVVFEANGTDNYFIVVEGVGGAYGEVKLKITSF